MLTRKHIQGAGKTFGTNFLNAWSTTENDIEEIANV